MICPDCGHKNKETSTFCVICGAQLIQADVFRADAAEKEELRAKPKQKLEMVLRDGRYEIEEKLGEGGMGRIYLSRDTKMDYKVVIKELLPIFVTREEREYVTRRFKEEAKILFRLDFRGLPKVIDYFQDGGNMYIVMQYIEGDNLSVLMKNRPGGRITLDETLSWMKDLIRIIKYLHNQNPPIIHRDIKPKNIMLNKQGELYLVDFGLARTIGMHTHTGTSVGTYGYSSPEHYSGKFELSSDIFSLGATFHHLLTADDPQNRDTFDYPPLSKYIENFPPKLQKIFDKMLTVRKSQRFQRLEFVEKALDEFMEEYEESRKSSPPVTSKPVPPVKTESEFIDEIEGLEPEKPMPERVPEKKAAEIPEHVEVIRKSKVDLAKVPTGVKDKIIKEPSTAVGDYKAEPQVKKSPEKGKTPVGPPAKPASSVRVEEEELALVAEDGSIITEAVDKAAPVEAEIPDSDTPVLEKTRKERESAAGFKVEQAKTPSFKKTSIVPLKNLLTHKETSAIPLKNIAPKKIVIPATEPVRQNKKKQDTAPAVKAARGHDALKKIVKKPEKPEAAPPVHKETSLQPAPARVTPAPAPVKTGELPDVKTLDVSPEIKKAGMDQKEIQARTKPVDKSAESKPAAPVEIKKPKIETPPVQVKRPEPEVKAAPKPEVKAKDEIREEKKPVIEAKVEAQKPSPRHEPFVQAPPAAPVEVKPPLAVEAPKPVVPQKTEEPVKNGKPEKKSEPEPLQLKKPEPPPAKSEPEKPSDKLFAAKKKAEKPGRGKVAAAKKPDFKKEPEKTAAPPVIKEEPEKVHEAPVPSRMEKHVKKAIPDEFREEKRGKFPVAAVLIPLILIFLAVAAFFGLKGLRRKSLPTPGPTVVAPTGKPVFTGKPVKPTVKPAEPKTPVATTGLFRIPINSGIDQAIIYTKSGPVTLDGSTGAEMAGDLPPGQYKVKLIRKGYYPALKTNIKVQAGGDYELPLNEVEWVQKPSLAIKTNEEAVITIFDKNNGKTIVKDEKTLADKEGGFVLLKEDLETHKYKIAAEKEGFVEEVKEVTPQKGKAAMVELNLSKKPSLTITSSRAAKITLINQSTGSRILDNAPTSVSGGKNTLKKDDLDVGKYKVVAGSSGYNDASDIVELKKGENKSVSLTLTKYVAPVREPVRPYNPPPVSRPYVPPSRPADPVLGK